MNIKGFKANGKNFKYDYAALANLPSSLVPDWDQNDETATDYVKNRTHWTDNSGRAEIYPVTDHKTTDMGCTSITVAENIVSGETYIIIWNGTEYECTAENNVDGVILLSSNEVPFYIEGAETDYDVYPNDGSNSFTIAIYKSVETVHKLPMKYLEMDCIEKYEEIISEITTTVNDSDMFSVAKTRDIVAGQTCTVVWNGIEYQCEAEYDSENGCITLGHENVFGSELYDDDSTWTVFVYDGSDTVTLAVYLKESTYKWPAKYLDVDEIKASLPTIELTAFFDDPDNPTKTYKLYGEVIS